MFYNCIQNEIKRYKNAGYSDQEIDVELNHSTEFERLNLRRQVLQMQSYINKLESELAIQKNKNTELQQIIDYQRQTTQELEARLENKTSENEALVRQLEEMRQNG